MLNAIIVFLVSLVVLAVTIATFLYIKDSMATDGTEPDYDDDGTEPEYEDEDEDEDENEDEDEDEDDLEYDIEYNDSELNVIQATHRAQNPHLYSDQWLDYALDGIEEMRNTFEYEQRDFMNQMMVEAAQFEMELAA